MSGWSGRLSGFDLGGDVGGGAEVREIGGEAVGEVDAGGGEAAAEDGLAGGEAWLREEVRVVAVVVRRFRGFEWIRASAGRGERGELGGGAAEGAGDEDAVAGLGAGAAEGAAGGRGAEEDDVDE